jgi:FemAB-related protein (PEP-CTERM system-associated)
MNLRHFNETDRTAWDDYVLNHPGGTFFHLTGWKDVVERCFGHKAFYLLSEEGGKICGIFPLFSVKSFLFGRAMVSVPFASYGGVLADDQGVAQALYREAVSITQKQGLDYLELRSETAGFGELPTKDLYYVFKKEIASDNEMNLEAIPRKTRRMVRVGMKNGLEAEFGSSNLLDTFYGMFAFNYRRLGTPVFSRKYIRNLLEMFGKMSSILIISKDGKPLSGVLSFYYKDQVIPYYSGAYPEAQDHAANDFLYWALTSDSAEKGYRVFDFGRSKKDTGPYNFKRHWGFEPKPLEYQYYLNGISELPYISPSNPKYQRRIEMWKRLPLWATKIIGPRIVKYIP